MRIVPPLLLMTVLPVSIQSGAVAAEDPESSAVEFFEQQVRPLLHRRCYECHSAQTAAENGELAVDSSRGLQSGGSRGRLAVPGHSAESLIIRAIRYGDEELQMPPEGKLSEAEISILVKWVERGAVVPEFGNAVTPPAVLEIDWERGRKFWSFQPLSNPEVPSVAGGSRLRRPLDAFIERRLNEHGLQLGDAADRVALIRRAAFDLTGLPPTPDEVEAFVADPRPDAYEQLVDRLLASPQYGPRWGRFWLDLARYTDTTASWLESTGEAWLYRDWVVNAWNADVPYDEFVRLQLSADQRAKTAPADQAALGFLGLSPTYWKELQLAPNVIERVVAEEWDERIDAVSRTFLGLTVSCARCHDHKFDPIGMPDYYALAGVFASTRLTARPLLPDAETAVVRAAHAEFSRLQSELEKLKEKESAAALELRQQMEQLRQDTPHFDAEWAHVVEDAAVYVLPDGDHRTRLDYRAGEVRDVPVFRRGNPANPGDVVPRRFLAIFSPNEPAAFQHGSGRQELADALFEQARPLTARVIVNRVWEQHFGVGLVSTPSNFGTQGAAPTHPELLDYLAGELIDHQWSLKWLHRELMTSAVYRQSSRFRPEAAEIDPENRLLWRMNRRRLPIEMWRDAMLAAAGNLKTTLGGAPQELDDAGNNRRTIYGTIARRDLNRMLRLYDFPEPTAHSPRREPTTTPLQQLFVLNAPFMSRQAELLAARVRAAGDNDAARIELCYRYLFSRRPTPQERALGLQFLNAGGDGSQRWPEYAHALLGLNEFLFTD